MKNKLFLAGMFGMVLAFGIVVIGCDNGSTDNEGGGGSGNPFVGTWNGTATLNSQSAPAVITVTGSTWNFVCQTAGMNESGSYTYSGNSATLKSGNTVIGSATVSGSNLSVVLTGSSYAGGVGTFSK
jgi:hypothetical protein